ncbi:DUF2635 domain-containing protein [Cupriavidus pauculus]|uniref:DUF2635 domain-containing protein n=1 Tax=Cupriavidus pauculus TaxID=82633 RepID=UPI001EE282A7|nr:DUF2635 domain-containing protein [Cupriavidus pauculus]GJG92837.1 DUF2635 domain-containing protein [Cupriavidus pauculus]
MKIKPAPGLKVRDPVTKQLIEPGHEVDVTDFYWHARLRDGDVLPIEEQSSAQAGASTKGGAKE